MKIVADDQEAIVPAPVVVEVVAVHVQIPLVRVPVQDQIPEQACRFVHRAICCTARRILFELYFIWDFSIHQHVAPSIFKFEELLETLLLQTVAGSTPIANNAEIIIRSRNRRYRLSKTILPNCIKKKNLTFRRIEI